MEESKQSTLQYESTKAVLKFMSLEKRRQIDTHIPGLKTTNAFLPFHYESVRLDDRNFGINEKNWSIREPIEGQDQEERMQVHYSIENVHQKTYIFEKSRDELIEKLINAHLKHETKIDKLSIFEFPKCMEQRDPSNFQLNIKELELDFTQMEIFQWIRPFVAKSAPLRKIEFRVIDETLPMFEDPLVLTSDTVRLYYPHFLKNAVKEIRIDLKNPHVEMGHSNFPVEKFQELVTNWKINRRPIGNTFVLGILENAFIPTVFENLKEHLGAIPSRIPALGDDRFSHAVTIPINAESEMVVNSGVTTFELEGRSWHCVLKVEVMPRGSTIYE